MCGITGIVSKDRISVDKGVIHEMTDSLIHRGPDDCGYYFSEECMMGHRRLSIIDLKFGHQPMTNEDKSVWIVFNGEIYNFQEIRPILESKNHTFKTNCDTEVLIHAYEEYGTELFRFLNGMFSFAVWDSNKKILLIARDRLGIKPLFYTLFDNSLIFASEVKAILNYPGIERIPNYEALSSYLTFRTVIDEECFFKNIFQLSPGSFLTYNNGHIRKDQYWKLPFNNNDQDLGENYYLENVEELLKRAIKRRMISDVPLGAYLSGGLDSSLLVAMMSEMSSSPVKTFSIGFQEEDYNEFKYAQIVSQKFNTEHQQIVYKIDDYFAFLQKLVAHRGSPLSIPHEVALATLSMEMKKDITVVLSGEGADELFGGYGRVLRSPMDLKEIDFCNRLSRPLQELYIKIHRQGDKLRKNLNIKSEMDYFFEVYNWMSFNEKKDLFTNEINREIKWDQNLISHFKELFDETKHIDNYNKFLYIFEKKHLVALLERLDMMSMVASIEARVPFVDHELVEFVTQIPVKYKMKWKSGFHKLVGGFYFSEKASEWLDVNKYLLRKLGEKKLPNEIAYRKKLGFPVPLDSWMNGKMKNFARDILLDKKTLDRKIFRPERLESLLNNSRNLEYDFYGKKVWMLINIELWFREFIDSN